MGKEKKKGNCLTMLDQILLKLSQFFQAFSQMRAALVVNYNYKEGAF